MMLDRIVYSVRDHFDDFPKDTHEAICGCLKVITDGLDAHGHELKQNAENAAKRDDYAEAGLRQQRGEEAHLIAETLEAIRISFIKLA